MRVMKRLTLVGLVFILGVIGADTVISSDSKKMRATLQHPNFSIPRYNGDYLNKIRMDRVITPHIDFAKPLYGGPVDVLVIVPIAGYGARDVVELNERFDMKVTAVTLNRPNYFQSDQAYTTAVMGQTTLEKTRALEKALLKKHDVIVIANFNFDKLPDSVQFQLLKAVKNGTGLVQFFENNKTRKYKNIYQPIKGVTGESIMGNLAFKGTWLANTDAYYNNKHNRILRYSQKDNAQIADDWVKAFQFGTGRIVTVYHGTGNQAPYPHTGSMGYACVKEPGTYDMGMQIAAKAILWAAKRDLPAILTSDIKSGKTFSNPASIPVTFKVATSAKNLKKPFSLENVVIDIEGNREFREKNPCAESAEIAISQLKSGRHFLISTLRDADGKVLDFASSAFIIERDATIALDGEDLYPENDKTATLGVVVEKAPADSKILFQAFDAYGREFWKESLSADAKTVTIPIDHAMGRYAKVRATLSLKGSVLCETEKELFLERETGKKFVRLMWGHFGDSRRDFSWDLSGRQLQKAGVTHGMIFPGKLKKADLRARAFCRTDSGWMVYATGLARGPLKRILENNERPEREKKLTKLGERLKGYGTYLYSLGDEDEYGNGAWKIEKGTVKAYRDYLKKKYDGKISSLNNLWKTSFKNFNEIEPLSDPTKRDAKIAPTRRYDQIRFWEWAYADTLRWMATAIKKGDPKALVGAEGSSSGDLELTISGLDWWAPYEDRVTNAMLMFWKRGTHLGNWWGGYTCNHGARAGTPILWRLLLSGSVNSSMFFIAACGSECMFATDLDYAEFYTDMIKDLKFIQYGPGILLKNSTIIDDQVGIYWSKANEHAANFYPGFGSCMISQNALVSAFQRDGINARFVTPRQIAKGTVDLKKLKILFMPNAMIIPSDTLPALESFVKSGGMLVADVAPGIVDSNMREIGYSKRIEKLFGFKTDSPKPKSSVENVKLTVHFKGNEIKIAAEKVQCDTSVKTDQAKAMVEDNGVPGFLISKKGEGEALLLNMNLYPIITAPGSDALAKILSAAGVKASVRTKGAEWKTVMRKKHADAILLGMCREKGDLKDTVTLDKDYTIYDIKNMKPLGVGNKIEIGNGTQFLFSLLPTSKREIKLNAPDKVRRGDFLKFSGKVDAGGKQVEKSLLRAELFDAKGQLMECYTTFAFSGAESENMRIPIALNDIKGEWKLRVTELCSGLTVERKVAVE